MVSTRGKARGTCGRVFVTSLSRSKNNLSKESTCQSHSGLARFEGAVNAFKLDHDEKRPTKSNNVPIKYVTHLDVKMFPNMSQECISGVC